MKTEVRTTNTNLLEQLYRQNYRRIFLFVFSLCKNREQAEDITQESFVKAMLTLPDNHPNPLAWLYRVANNLVTDAFRKSKFTADTPLEELPEQASEVDETAEQYIKGERYRRLYAAMDTLEETEKRLLVLYYFSGLSQQEIAGVTSLSFANVRVKMTRAKNKLRTVLSEEDL